MKREIPTITISCGKNDMFMNPPCNSIGNTASSVNYITWTANSSKYGPAIINLDRSLTTIPESTPYVRPDFVPYTTPVNSFLEEPKYVYPVNKDSEYTRQDLSIKDHSSYLQSKFATFDVGYGQIHSDAIIGTNPTSRGVSFMEEVNNTIRTEVSKGTLHHKLVINAYNRGLVDYDLYHLGIKLSGSTGTTTSGVTLNLCLFDLHQNNLTTYGMNNFLHFFKWQNINEINFSSNKLGDDSCRQLGEAFSASWLPHLFNIDLSNNQITDTGARYLSDPIYQGKMPKLVNLYITDNYLTYMGKEILINTVCQIQWKQKISVTVDQGIAMPDTETQLILKNWCLLQNKYSSIDVGYGKIHNNPIIGESYSYKRIPFMDEVAGTIKMVKDLGTLHHKLVVNAYNRELVDSDLYYLGNKITNHYDPKVIAPPTISNVTLNLCLFDLHNNNITHLGVHNFLHFFKGQNIKEVNLSNNKIGDEGAKLLADSLSKGEMPNLKKLHLESNNITDKGDNFIINAIKNIKQHIIVLTRDLKEDGKMIFGSKEEKIIEYKKILAKCSEQGINNQVIVVNKTSFDKAKNLGQVGASIVVGFSKCHWELETLTQWYAQDKILAKLPKIGKILVNTFNADDILSCYVESKKEAFTSPIGCQIIKDELCVMGETEFCE